MGNVQVNLVRERAWSLPLNHFHGPGRCYLYKVKICINFNSINAKSTSRRRGERLLLAAFGLLSLLFWVSSMAFAPIQHRITECMVVVEQQWSSGMDRFGTGLPEIE
ncbi:hypothetical protein TNCT_566961 [Trichonephila clavata]|uniref:Uncharacterized protein n=1 Tax=Trichonephila clavata TaxID=2740835 RepID=A0A8X6LEJ2_TRICU|nr:hypothetical protein TNCT_566961 [Trichonephila clavata]